MQDESTETERLSGGRQADADAIRELLDRQVQGWATGDPGVYASVFAPDADYVTFLGTHHQGRDAIAAAYVPLFRKLRKDSRLDVRITQLRFLTPDVALVHAEGAVVKGRRRTRGNVRINTTVAVWTDGRWQLAATQNTTHRRLAERLMGMLFS